MFGLPKISTILSGIKEFFLPKEVNFDPESFTKDQLRALSDRRTLSKMLFYRTYLYDEENNMGLYVQADGRMGIVLEVTPPPYLNENVENTIINMLNAIVNDETVCHIMTFASRNIDPIIDDYEKVHPCKKINVGEPGLLQDFIKETAKSFRSWKNESIMGKDGDLRVRNFRHVISILFPYDLDKRSIKQQYNQISGILRDLNCRNLPANEFIPLIQEILNPDKDTFSTSEDNITSINKQMAKDAVITLDEENAQIDFNNGWKGNVLTTHKYPPEVDLFSYQNIFFDIFGNEFQNPLPCPFLVTLTIKFTDVEKTRKELMRKAKWNIGQLQGLPIVMEKKMPEIKDKKKEAEEVIYNYEKLGEFALEANYTILVCDKNQNDLDRYTAMIIKSFDTYKGRWLLRKERFPQIALQNLLMSLPLQYSEVIHSNLQRFDKNFRSNNAQIVPLIGDFKGNGKPVIIFPGRTGQLMALDVFASKTNYNIIIIGPMGSGKSFFMNNLQLNFMGAEYDIRMIDFGRSYLRLSENIEGQFLEFEKDNTVCLNFFTNINTTFIKNEHGEDIEVIHPDEFETLVPIIGLMMGVNLRNIYKNTESSEQEKLGQTVITRFVIKALERAFKMKGREAGMREVLDSIREFKKEEIDTGETSGKILEILDMIATGIENYSVENAPYYKYFNGVNNINFKSSHFIAEFDDIADSPVMPVIAMSVLQRFAQEAFIEYLKDKSKARLIGVDEAWRVLSSPLFVQFLEDFARRIRKYRGITAVITQSVNDFFGNSSAQVMFDTAAFKVFLPQGAEAINKAVKDNQIVLNSVQKKLMQSVKSRKPHYNEFYVKTDSGDFIGLLKVNSVAYWLFTTDPKDRNELDIVQKKYNLSSRDAVWFLAKRMDGLEDNEILYKMSRERKGTINDIDWDMFLKDVLHNNRLLMAYQSVYEYETNTELYKEIFMRLQDKNGKIYYPDQFIIAAKDLNRYTQISISFIKKTIEYLKKESVDKIAINMDISEIEDSDFKNYFLETVRTLRDSDILDRLIVEIELNYKTKKNIDLLFDFARNLKEEGVNMAFDNVKLSELDITTLSKILPLYIKIDLEEIRNTVKDKHEKDFIHNIVNYYREGLKIRTVATRVESEEDLDFAKELGIRVAQGYYFGKPQLLA